MSMMRTVSLLGILTAVLLVIGFLWQGVVGMTFFLFIAFVINFLSYWYSDKIILKIYHAKPISKSDEPKLHSILEKLSEEAKIPKPKLYVVNLPIPNAFATGRNAKNGVIAVTSGLLKHLNWKEVEGVVAHEISHIKNRDTLTSAIAATIGGAIAWIAQIAWYSLFFRSGRRGSESLIFLPLIILAPLAAVMIQMAISRTREFVADRMGALISKKPLDLASALEKIAKVSKQYPLHGNSATSHMFIINPFKVDTLGRLFSTHPPVEERIKRLKGIAKDIGV